MTLTSVVDSVSTVFGVSERKSDVGSTIQQPALLLALLPAIATLGEGGASVLGLLSWHAVVLILVLAALLERKDVVRYRAAGLPLGLWCVFLAIVLAGAARAPYAYAAWLNGVELAAITAVFVLAAGRGPSLIRFAVWPLALTASLQSVLAIYQRTIGGHPRPAGTFLNPNHLGGFLVAVLLLLAGEALVAKDSRSRLLAAALASPALVAVLISGSRGALLAGLAGVAYLLIAVWPRIGKRSRMALIAGCLLVALPMGFRVAERLRDTDPYLYHRLKIWRAATGPLLENPLWGSGPGQFAVAANRYQFDDGHGPIRFDRAFRVTHSDIVRVPVEYGAPAAVALIVALLAGLGTIRRARGTDCDVGTPGVAAALLAVAAQSVVDNPSRWPALYLLAALLLASLLSRRSDGVVASVRSPRLVRVGAAGVLALVFLVAELGPTLAYLKVASLPQDGLTPTDLAVLELAEQLNPVQPELKLRQMEARIAGTEPLSLEDYATAREAAERALHLSPQDSRYHWGLARLEGQACLRLFHTEASRDRTYARLEDAQRWAPTDARIPLHAAEFGLAVGDPAYARRMAERALALEPQAVGGHVLLARALLAQGEHHREQAMDLVNTAVALALEHAASAENGYARKLLTLNPEQVLGLQTRGAPTDGNPSATEPGEPR